MAKNELHINKLKIDHEGDVTGTGSKLLTNEDPSVIGNISITGTPTEPNHLVTKDYADTLTGGGGLTNRQIQKRISHRR